MMLLYPAMIRKCNENLFRICVCDIFNDKGDDYITFEGESEKECMQLAKKFLEGGIWRVSRPSTPLEFMMLYAYRFNPDDYMVLVKISVHGIFHEQILDIMIKDEENARRPGVRTRYPAIIQHSLHCNGCFCAVPDLDISVQGINAEDAVKNAREAIRYWTSHNECPGPSSIEHLYSSGWLDYGDEFLYIEANECT